MMSNIAKETREQEVSFVLSGEYPASSVTEAEAVVRKLISSGVPGFALDSKGTACPFYRETVEGISVTPHPPRGSQTGGWEDFVA